MVFHSAGEDVRDKARHPVPIKQLIDFERVTGSHGTTASVTFSVDISTGFALVNEDGQKTLYKGHHDLIISRGHGTDVKFSFEL